MRFFSSEYQIRNPPMTRKIITKQEYEHLFEDTRTAFRRISSNEEIIDVDDKFVDFVDDKRGYLAKMNDGLNGPLPARAIFRVRRQNLAIIWPHLFEKVTIRFLDRI